VVRLAIHSACVTHYRTPVMFIRWAIYTHPMLPVSETQDPTAVPAEAEIGRRRKQPAAGDDGSDAASSVLCVALAGRAVGGAEAPFRSSPCGRPSLTLKTGVACLSPRNDHPEKLDRNRLPGAVDPGFRPMGGAMLNLLRLPF